MQIDVCGRNLLFTWRVFRLVCSWWCAVVVVVVVVVVVFWLRYGGVVCCGVGLFVIPTEEI
jgi:hypothetical protein